jgi:hypothetical protein
MGQLQNHWKDARELVVRSSVKGHQKSKLVAIILRIKKISESHYEEEALLVYLSQLFGRRGTGRGTNFRMGMITGKSPTVWRGCGARVIWR